MHAERDKFRYLPTNDWTVQQGKVFDLPLERAPYPQLTPSKDASPNENQARVCKIKRLQTSQYEPHMLSNRIATSIGDITDEHCAITFSLEISELSYFLFYKS